MGQTSQKFIIGPIHREIQTWFPSKQLSIFRPARSHSKYVFFYKMIQFPYPIFHPFPGKLSNFKMPKVLYMYGASLYWNQFFPELQAAFLYQGRFQILNTFELWNFMFYCLQRKLGRLRIPKPAFSSSSSWDSNWSLLLPPTSQWTFIIVYKVTQ